MSNPNQRIAGTRYAWLGAENAELRRKRETETRLLSGAIRLMAVRGVCPNSAELIEAANEAAAFAATAADSKRDREILINALNDIVLATVKQKGLLETSGGLAHMHASNALAAIARPLQQPSAQ